VFSEKITGAIRVAGCAWRADISLSVPIPEKMPIVASQIGSVLHAEVSKPSAANFVASPSSE
jgi:hypothetical protein